MFASMVSPKPLLPLLFLALSVACSPGETDGVPVGRPEGDARELRVSAAASLTDAFRELATAFESTEPGVRVVLNVGGSSALKVQIQEGAPVDVFAPADPGQLEELTGALAGPPRIFAVNRLAIAVPVGNPGGVTGLADLARPGLLVGLCAEEVPCGELAREALARAGVTAAPDTEEPNVRALLTKVELGALAAAVTPARAVPAAGGAVQGIELPDAWNVEARYAVAALRDAPNSSAAGDFVAFLLSPRGRDILVRHGFALPAGSGGIP
jgi:molybdate transport system substrate-binding protein